MSRPIVFCPIRYYLPCYKAGGVPRVIANVVDLLGDEYDFRIVTSDRDELSDQPYGDIPPYGEWSRVGKASVRYLSPSEMNVSTIRGIMRERPAKLVFLNGFFDPLFIQLPALVQRWTHGKQDTSLLIGPRGEFHPGAYGLKAWKKKPCSQLHRVMGTYSGAEWLASDVQEESDIQRIMGKVNVHICPDMPTRSTRPMPTKWTKVPGHLKVVFYSRLTPKKNLPFALAILSSLQLSDQRVEFDICGPWESPGYQASCEPAMKAMPAGVTVRYMGEVKPDNVSGLLAQYDLMFLPTLGENFGFVILEALEAGCPVLLSDQTPWDGLSDARCGWSFSLNAREEYVRALSVALAWNEVDRQAAGIAAQEYSRQKIIQMDAAKKWRALFQRLTKDVSADVVTVR